MTHCYVIAGGPSLRDFPFDQLPAGYRIGANLSGWLANCDALVTLDRAMHRRNAEDLRKFKGQVYAGLKAHNIHEPIPNVNYWTFESGDGFSTKPGFLSGSNSGFAAFNLAYLLGFTDIALLGFDFQWIGGQHHWRDDYPSPGRRYHDQLCQWARAFDKPAAYLKAKGIRVTNFVGPSGSRVTAFPTAPLAELL
jgi:hypothetical protein